MKTGAKGQGPGVKGQGSRSEGQGAKGAEGRGPPSVAALGASLRGARLPLERREGGLERPAGLPGLDAALGLFLRRRFVEQSRHVLRTGQTVFEGQKKAHTHTHENVAKGISARIRRTRQGGELA